MDTKQQFGQLDPKLKEVYERVMGTSVSSAPKVSSVPPKPVAPTPVAIPQPENPKSQIPQAPIASQPQSPTQAISVKPHGHISPFVWILGGLTFVIIYALAWIKIFNFKLPFTP